MLTLICERCDKPYPSDHPTSLCPDCAAPTAEKPIGQRPDWRTGINDAILQIQAWEYQLRVAVASARKSGVTWQDIGDVLGVTRQAAYDRFG